LGRRRRRAGGRHAAASAPASRRLVDDLVGEQGLGAQAERHAQLGGVEVRERARLRQHEVGDVALARHDLLDPLVDRARADQPVRDDDAGLADAPGAVPGLVLDRRVPPAVVEHDVAGGRSG
jgi:hypothetical protein